MTMPSGPTGSPQRRRLLGRRYNRRVGIAATGVVVVVVAAGAYAAYENGQRTQERRLATAATPEAANAADWMKDAPSGYIKPSVFRPTYVAPTIKLPAEPTEQQPQAAPAPDDNGRGAERKKAWTRYWAEYDALQKLKADNLGDARKAMTSISISTAFGVTPAAASGSAPASSGDQDMTAGGAPGQASAGNAGDDAASRTEKRRFMGQHGDSGQDDVLQSSRKSPLSPYAVMAGSYIPAILETAVNSDSPGMFIARVNTDIDDTRTGQCIIIPAGSKLIGSYDSQVSMGQGRLPGVIKRVIYPDTTSADLGAMEAADQSGAAGFDADVNRHFWQRLGNGLIIGISGVGTSLFQQLPYGGAFAGPPADAINNTASLGLNIPPTLTAAPGTRINVITGKDLTLRPWSCDGHRIAQSAPTILTGDDGQ